MDSELKACFDKWEASLDALCRYLLHTAAGVTGPVTGSSSTNELAITSEGTAPASSSSSASPSLSTTWENVSPVAPTSCVKPCSTECAAQAMSATSDFLSTDNRVTAPVTSSSDRADLALAPAGLAEPAAPVPGIGEPLAVAPAAPIHTIAGLPASCSMDCAAQTITMWSSTLLPWAARSSSAPASKINGVVSTESVPDNDAGEHGTLFDDGTVDVMHVIAAATAGSVTLDAAAVHASSVDCTAQVVTAPSTMLTTTMSPLMWASVISTKLCPENDDVEHGPLLTMAPAHSSELGVPTMLSTSSTTEVSVVLPAAPVYIPWASTKPWLEPVPPHPPDLWSLFLGAWSVSRPPDSLGCNGGLFSTLRPCLPAPAPKPPWLLLGLEKVTGHGHPAFVIVSVHLLSEAKLATIVFPSEFHIRAVSADVQQWLLLIGIIGEWSCLIGSVKKVAPAVTYYGREELDLVNQYDSVVMLVVLTPWIYSIVMNVFELACLQNGEENSDLLLLPWLLEQEELSIGFQLQQNILADWYLHNQSILITVDLFIPLKYYLLSDKLRARLLCVRSIYAAIQVLVLPDGKYSRNWQGAQTAIGRDAQLFLIQSVVMNYMDYWWLTTVSLTEIVSIFSARFPVQMEVTCSVQTKLLLDHAYRLSFGREQGVQSSHKGCIMILCHITIYDSAVEWHISMHSQCLFIGVMHIGNETMQASNIFSSRNNSTFFSNSETPRYDLLVASSEVMWFCRAFVGGQGTFQGGRHMPVLYQHKELRLSWDPSGAAAACGQGSIPSIAVTTFFDQVSAGHLGASFHRDPIGHDYYFYHSSSLGYHCDPDQITEHRLQWDPGGFSVASAWGQAGFQGGRDVRNLSYRCMYLGLPPGPQHGPTLTLHIPESRQRSDHPSWIRTDGTAAAFFSHLFSLQCCSSCNRICPANPCGNF